MEGGQSAALLDERVSQTRDLGTQIKRRIEALKKQPAPRGQEGRKDQVYRLRARNVSVIGPYSPRYPKRTGQRRRQAVHDGSSKLHSSREGISQETT